MVEEERAAHRAELASNGWLGDEEKSTNSAARHLKQELGEQEYRLLLMSVGAQNLADVVRLFPDLELTRGGYSLQ